MIKRIVEVSQGGTYLSIALGQLVIRRGDEEMGRIPCEDIGVLLIDHGGTIYTHTVLTELLGHKAAVVLCDGRHHPVGMLLPVESNSLQSERFREQIAAKEPLKKQLWKQLVRGKIAHQAELLKDEPATHRALKNLRKEVKSGDPSNVEAQASRKFWPVYAQDTQFRRDVDGAPPNNLLNYGYTVMRAAVARALCCAGLLCTLGIHHRNRYNAFCLADDVMEPFRGYVEAKVREICHSEDDIEELSQGIKGRLLEVLYESVVIGGQKGPLMVGLHRTAGSLVRCFAGESKKLELPKF